MAKKMDFNKMRIQKRLNTAFNIVVIAFSAVGVLAMVVMGLMIYMFDTILDKHAFPQRDIGQMMTAASEARSAVRGAVGFDSQEMTEAMAGLFDQAVIDFETELENVRPVLVTAEGKAYLDTIDAVWPEYKSLAQDIISDSLAATTAEEKLEQQQRTIDELVPKYSALSEAINGVQEAKTAYGHKSAKMANGIAIACILIIIAMIAFVFVLSRRITRQIVKGIQEPLSQISDRLATFAQGDLDTPFPEVENQDEIADMIEEVRNMAEKLSVVIKDSGAMLKEMAEGNFTITSEVADAYVGQFSSLLVGMEEMNDEINQTLKELDQSTVQVSVGASNMAQAAQSLAEGAMDQAASVEQMQATITSLTEAVETTAQQLKQAAEEAEGYAQEAENSRTDMELLVTSMEHISNSSEKIGNIISEIEDIASQTNLLSLNASIEAARAGEAGRGFAVVADQIRTLAEQSAKSAVDSRALIEESLNEVAEGNRVAGKTSESLHGVVAGVHEIAETSKRLSQMSADQAYAIEQADQGMNRISEVVQSNSATAEESSATSQELNAQATTMGELVAQFKLK